MTRTIFMVSLAETDKNLTSVHRTLINCDFRLCPIVSLCRTSRASAHTNREFNTLLKMEASIAHRPTDGDHMTRP